jgi:hypothetical protein
MLEIHATEVDPVIGKGMKKLLPNLVPIFKLNTEFKRRPCRADKIQLIQANAVIKTQGLETNQIKAGISVVTPRWLAPPLHSLPAMLHII